MLASRSTKFDQYIFNSTYTGTRVIKYLYEYGICLHFYMLKTIYNVSDVLKNQDLGQLLDSILKFILTYTRVELYASIYSNFNFTLTGYNEIL